MLDGGKIVIPIFANALMGPFRLRLEPVIASRLARCFSSQPTHTIKKADHKGRFFLVGVAGFEPAQA